MEWREGREAESCSNEWSGVGGELSVARSALIPIHLPQSYHVCVSLREIETNERLSSEISSIFHLSFS